MPKEAYLHLVPGSAAAEALPPIALEPIVRAELVDHLRISLATCIRLADLLDFAVPAALICQALDGIESASIAPRS